MNKELFTSSFNFSLSPRIWWFIVLLSFLLGLLLGTTFNKNLFPITQREHVTDGSYLSSVLDTATFESFVIEEANFSDSCFIIEAMLREKLPETEIPDGRLISTNLRVLVGTYREGSQSIHCQTGASIRKVLETFVSSWGIAALIDGDTIIFSENLDRSRFKHEHCLSIP